MKISKSLLFGATAVWLCVLAFCAFFTEMSSFALTNVYIIGQGFLIALLIPYLQQSKKCRSSKN